LAEVKHLEKTVRSTVTASARSCLIGLLAATLLNLPTMAAGAPTVGMIAETQDGLLSGSTAARGVDVYSGDTLMTQPDGSMRLAAGSGQIYLMSATQATMERDGSIIRTKLDRGTVDFSSATGKLEIETPLGVVRGDSTSRTFGQVAILDPTTIRVRAITGNLIVAGADGVMKNIPAGETFEASFEPAGGPDNGPPVQGVGGRRRIRWRRIIATAVIIGGTALVTGLLYEEFTESCSKINCGQK
jgi:hypothetical protein